jgi:hypothetical protein
MHISKKFVVASGLLACFAGAQGQVLYAATAAGAAGHLYTINPTTGAIVTDIGVLNNANGVNYPISGLAFHPTTGVLYGSTGNNSTVPGRLVSINTSTGLVTDIGALNTGVTNSSGVPSTMSDLSFTAAGQLVGVASIGGPNLYTINTSTGQATLVGPSGLTSTTGGGLAISSAGVYYGTPTATRFGTYNSSTGAYTNIATTILPLGGSIAALAFNGSGTLYGLNLGTGTTPPTHLVTINQTTGVLTDVAASVTQLDAIAFQPVPEPATIAAIGLGLAGLLRRRARTGRK